MAIHPREWWLYGQVVAVERLRGIGCQVRDRIRSQLQDESGQTPTEYLMIVGLMAMVIVVVFVTLFWGQIKDAAATWAVKASNAIQGGGIDTPAIPAAP